MGMNVDQLLNTIDVARLYLEKLSFPEPTLRSSLKQPNKSNAESGACREIGNIEYADSSKYGHEAALEWYTKSVAWATDGSRELALAYGNRSAVLLRLHKYNDCLLDVNRALKCDCPEETEARLQRRKQQCIAILDSRKDKINYDQMEPVESTEVDSTLPKLSGNSLLPNTSSKIRLAYDRKWGRHMVATEDIEPGEVLSIEEFFAASLIPSRHYTHCSYCFVKCESLIGCQSCSKMMYCSGECRTRAYNAYHRVECGMWSFYEDERLDVFDIAAIRALLVGTEQGAKLNNLADRAGSIFNQSVNFVGKPFKNDYLSLLKLHRAVGEPPKMIVLLAVKAIMVLQHFSFFESWKNKDMMKKSRLFATITLINHLTAINSFSFPLSDIFPRKGFSMSSSNERKIGLGVCALHSLVNHSCDPNVADVIRKRKHIYFSVRPISRGQQIFFSYGISFAKNNLRKRHETLQKFGFSCSCQACAEVWPKYPRLKELNTNFKNKNRKMMASLMSLIEKMDANQSRRCTAGRFKILVRSCKLLWQNVNPPCEWIVLCEELITHYMRETFGNFYDGQVQENGF